MNPRLRSTPWQPHHAALLRAGGGERATRAKPGTDHGSIQRVARQLGYGTESIRLWVRQADIDEGRAPGVSIAESARMRELEQKNYRLRRANETLEREATFLEVELDRQHRK